MTPPTHRFYHMVSVLSEARIRAFLLPLFYSNRVGGVMTPPYNLIFYLLLITQQPRISRQIPPQQHRNQLSKQCPMISPSPKASIQHPCR